MNNLHVIIIMLTFLISCCTNKIEQQTGDPKSHDSVYKLNETFRLYLDKNLSGGYEWTMTENDFVSLLEEKDSIYQKDSLSLAEHVKVFILIADSIGETTLYFNKKRSFEPDSLAIKNLHSEKIIIK